MEWRSPRSQSHKQFQFRKSENKMILVTFYESQRIIHNEFVPLGQGVNKEYCVKILSHLVQGIRRVRPQFQDRGK